MARPELSSYNRPCALVNRERSAGWGLSAHYVLKSNRRFERCARGM